MSADDFIEVKEEFRMNAREQIANLMRTMGGEKINVCGEIFKVIKEEEAHGGELLRFFCETKEGIESSEEVEASLFFTEGEVIDYTKDYGKIVDGIMENLFRKKPGREAFYNELWGKITLRELFQDEKTQIFALYYVWIDVRIPYFELPDTIKLSAAEYQVCVDKLRDRIQEARFILFSDFEQWTEVSYLLMKLLDDIEDKTERAVFLACIMQIRDRMLLQSRARQMTENILEEGNQAEK